MKTQFMECNDINCLSEFDPALSYIVAFLHSKKGLGSIRANNLRRLRDGLTLRKLCAH